MSFKKGDKVSIINESGYCSVVAEKSMYLTIVEDEHGFERIVENTKLSLQYSDDFGIIPDLSKDHMEVHVPVVEKKTRKAHTSNWNGFPYIDLHIEELVEDHLRLPVQDILQIQLSKFRSFILKCKENQQKKCFIIHGVGEGILRAEVHLYLHRQDNVEYFDAHNSDFGELGATEVIFL